jgi:hypothetical protein
MKITDNEGTRLKLGDLIQTPDFGIVQLIELGEAALGSFTNGRADHDVILSLDYLSAWTQSRGKGLAACRAAKEMIK